MKFHLNYSPKKSSFHIHHSDQLFFYGSCFSEHIATKLQTAGFKVNKNPSGILFSPIVMASELIATLNCQEINPSLIFEREGLYFSFEAHSSISADTSNNLVLKLNQTRNESLVSLKNCQFLFLTFGTAWHYSLLNQNIPVANCHKQAQQLFKKQLSEPEEISKLYESVLEKLKNINPNIRVIFTISPVKHLRDGVEENLLSKSILRYAIFLITKKFNHCTYFPAYELVTDDLRDHRFYEKDLAHPNELAIDYVWEKFKLCYFNDHTQKAAELAQQLHKAKTHRPLQKGAHESASFKAHIQNLEDQFQNAMKESH